MWCLLLGLLQVENRPHSLLGVSCGNELDQVSSGVPLELWDSKRLPGFDAERAHLYRAWHALENLHLNECKSRD